MKDIAYKSKSSILVLFIGVFAFIILAVIVCIAQPNGWLPYAIFCMICAVACLVSFVIELKKSNCLIKQENNLLWIYHKKQWISIEIKELLDVKFRRNRSGRTILRSGDIIIITARDTYKLYNVKNVQGVALTLHDLILINQLKVTT